MKKSMFLIMGLILISCSEEKEIESIKNTKKSNDEVYNKFMETCMIDDSKMYSEYCECCYKIYNKYSAEEYNKEIESSCINLLKK